MCLHISLTKSKKDIEIKSKMIFNGPLGFEPYYHFNGWETKNLAIVKQNDSKFIELASWGILPTNFNLSNRKEFLIKTNTLNATKERLFKSNLYSQFIKTQRCLILADGLFEPHTEAGVKRKTPYYFKEKNHNLFAFAGIYSKLETNQEIIYSASIITTEANPLFKKIHNKPNKLGSYRMPLILDPKDYSQWLHTSEEAVIKKILNSFTTQELITYPVANHLFSNKIDSNISSILNEVKQPQKLF